MGQFNDIEALREFLRDDSLHILLALVKRVAVSPDRSTCYVLVSILPEQRELVAQMTWDAVGAQGAGIYMLPQPGELVLVGQAEGDKDQAFVLRRLSSSDESIPLNADDGSIVLKSLPGKKAWITANRINLTKADGAPTENLVLGQQLKTVLTELIKTIYVQHKHIGNLGYYTAPPDNAPAATNLSANNVENENILSNVSFTEKGS